jgi:hypothetical protein
MNSLVNGAHFFSILTPFYYEKKKTYVKQSTYHASIINPGSEYNVFTDKIF